MNEDFSEDQVDALKELINIGLGKATSSIAELLDAFATIHVPEIIICNSDELVHSLNQKIDFTSKYYVTKQLFKGKFGGECMFVIGDTPASNLGKHLYQYEDISHDDINDSILELTNILSSTIISKLTEDLNSSVQFFVPSSQYMNAQALIEYDDIKDYSKIIIISTMLDFQDEKINGYIFILTKDEAMLELRNLIDNKLEELYF